MTAGKHVKALREERGLRPSDIERLSQRLADELANPDYAIPHATLNGIEGGSTPTIYKLASLATVLGIRIEEMLLAYGIDLSTQGRQHETGARIESAERRPGTRALNVAVTAATELVNERSSLWNLLPSTLLSRMGNPAQFSYAVVGWKDDTLCDLLPGGSLGEIDRQQNTIARFSWASMNQRPIYCLWREEGHVCCWCDQVGNLITLVPHPLSQQQSKQLRAPREVTVVGRVTNSWRLFSPAN
jgi:hypothetical protein